MHGKKYTGSVVFISSVRTEKATAFAYFEEILFNAHELKFADATDPKLI